MSSVSIIMPVFNAALTLDQAVQSVCNQTHVDWILWLVDDASTDQSFEKIQRWARMDSRIRQIRRPIRGGPALARNDALSANDSDYLAFLDADDTWLPHKLKLQVQCMDRYGWDISYCNYQRLHADRPWRDLCIVTPPCVMLSTLHFFNPILISSAMVRWSALKDLRFKPVMNEDYVFWHQALQQVAQAHRVESEGPLVRYRVSPDSHSANKYRSALGHWRNLRRDFGLSWPMAMCGFAVYALRSIRRDWLPRWVMRSGRVGQ